MEEKSEYKTVSIFEKLSSVLFVGGDDQAVLQKKKKKKNLSAFDRTGKLIQSIFS